MPRRLLSVFIALGLSLALLGATPLGRDSATGPDGKDNVMGAIWTFTITKDKEEETGQFRVYKKEVFKKDKKVGTVAVKDDDETTITFTDLPKLNGVAKLRKTRRHPPGAAGTLKKKDGSEWKMKVTWKDG